LGVEANTIWYIISTSRMASIWHHLTTCIDENTQRPINFRRRVALCQVKKRGDNNKKQSKRPKHGTDIKNERLIAKFIRLWATLYISSAPWARKPDVCPRPEHTQMGGATSSQHTQRIREVCRRAAGVSIKSNTQMQQKPLFRHTIMS
jgi:hypothetical protein